MRDLSSTRERKAPIRPLIQRAKMLAQEAAALQRRIEKRFPVTAVAITSRQVVKDTAHIALLLETYQHEQPEPNY